MGDPFESCTDRVTQGDDGIYRWYYDMDMYENKSMLYMLLRINLFIFLGVIAGGALLVGLVQRDFGAPMVRGVAAVGLIMWAAMSVMYVIGFYIAARIKGGRYRIRFNMREDGIALVWSGAVKQGEKISRAALRLAGSIAGSRRLGGRWRPTLDEVSDIAFSSVTRMKSHPRWDMIDLSMPGGKFQVYAKGVDFTYVEAFIRERVPEHARKA